MSKAITSCKKALAYLLTAAMVLGMAVTSPVTAVEVKADDVYALASELSASNVDVTLSAAASDLAAAQALTEDLVITVTPKGGNLISEVKAGDSVFTDNGNTTFSLTIPKEDLPSLTTLSISGKATALAELAVDGTAKEHLGIAYTSDTKIYTQGGKNYIEKGSTVTFRVNSNADNYVLDSLSTQIDTSSIGSPTEISNPEENKWYSVDTTNATTKLTIAMEQKELIDVVVEAPEGYSVITGSDIDTGKDITADGDKIKAGTAYSFSVVYGGKIIDKTELTSVTFDKWDAAATPAAWTGSAAALTAGGNPASYSMTTDQTDKKFKIIVTPKDRFNISLASDGDNDNITVKVNDVAIDKTAPLVNAITPGVAVAVSVTPKSGYSIDNVDFSLDGGSTYTKGSSKSGTDEVELTPDGNGGYTATLSASQNDAITGSLVIKITTEANVYTTKLVINKEDSTNLGTYISASAAAGWADDYVKYYREGAAVSLGSTDTVDDWKGTESIVMDVTIPTALEGKVKASVTAYDKDTVVADATADEIIAVTKTNVDADTGAGRYTIAPLSDAHEAIDIYVTYDYITNNVTIKNAKNVTGYAVSAVDQTGDVSVKDITVTDTEDPAYDANAKKYRVQKGEAAQFTIAVDPGTEIESITATNAAGSVTLEGTHDAAGDGTYIIPADKLTSDVTIEITKKTSSYEVTYTTDDSSYELYIKRQGDEKFTKIDSSTRIDYKTPVQFRMFKGTDAVARNDYAKGTNDPSKQFLLKLEIGGTDGDSKLAADDSVNPSGTTWKLEGKDVTGKLDFTFKYSEIEVAQGTKVSSDDGSNGLKVVNYDVEPGKANDATEYASIAKGKYGNDYKFQVFKPVTLNSATTLQALVSTDKIRVQYAKTNDAVSADNGADGGYCEAQELTPNANGIYTIPGDVVKGAKIYIRAEYIYTVNVNVGEGVNVDSTSANKAEYKIVDSTGTPKELQTGTLAKGDNAISFTQYDIKTGTTAPVVLSITANPEDTTNDNIVVKNGEADVTIDSGVYPITLITATPAYSIPEETITVNVKEKEYTLTVDDSGFSSTVKGSTVEIYDGATKLDKVGGTYTLKQTGNYKVVVTRKDVDKYTSFNVTLNTVAGGGSATPVADDTSVKFRKGDEDDTWVISGPKANLKLVVTDALKTNVTGIAIDAIAAADASATVSYQKLDYDGQGIQGVYLKDKVAVPAGGTSINAFAGTDIVLAITVKDETKLIDKVTYTPAGAGATAVEAGTDGTYSIAADSVGASGTIAVTFKDNPEKFHNVEFVFADQYITGMKASYHKRTDVTDEAISASGTVILADTKTVTFKSASSDMTIATGYEIDADKTVANAEHSVLSHDGSGNYTLELSDDVGSAAGKKAVVKIYTKPTPMTANVNIAIATANDNAKIEIVEGEDKGVVYNSTYNSYVFPKDLNELTLKVTVKDGYRLATTPLTVSDSISCTTAVAGNREKSDDEWGWVSYFKVNGKNINSANKGVEPSAPVTITVAAPDEQKYTVKAVGAVTVKGEDDATTTSLTDAQTKDVPNGKKLTVTVPKFQKLKFDGNVVNETDVIADSKTYDITAQLDTTNGGTDNIHTIELVALTGHNGYEFKVVHTPGASEVDMPVGTGVVDITDKTKTYEIRVYKIGADGQSVAFDAKDTVSALNASTDARDDFTLYTGQAYAYKTIARPANSVEYSEFKVVNDAGAGGKVTPPEDIIDNVNGNLTKIKLKVSGVIDKVELEKTGEITVKAGGTETIGVSVIDTNGEPIAAADITEIKVSPEYTVDKEIEAKYDGESGNVVIKVKDEVELPFSKEFTVSATVGGATKTETFTIVVAPAREIKEVTLTPAAEITYKPGENKEVTVAATTKTNEAVDLKGTDITVDGSASSTKSGITAAVSGNKILISGGTDGASAEFVVRVDKDEETKQTLKVSVRSYTIDKVSIEGGTNITLKKDSYTGFINYVVVTDEGNKTDIPVAAEIAPENDKINIDAEDGVLTISIAAADLKELARSYTGTIYAATGGAASFTLDIKTAPETEVTGNVAINVNGYYCTSIEGVLGKTISREDVEAAALAKLGDTDSLEGWYKDKTLRTKWNFATDVVEENTTVYGRALYPVVDETSGKTAKIQEVWDYTYTGSVIKPTVVITDATGTLLKINKDYKVNYSEKDNNKYAKLGKSANTYLNGELLDEDNLYYFTVEFIKDYSELGSQKVYYMIRPVALDDPDTTSVTLGDKTGQFVAGKIKPVASVKAGNKTLTFGKDYTYEVYKTDGSLVKAYTEKNDNSFSYTAGDYFIKLKAKDTVNFAKYDEDEPDVFFTVRDAKLLVKNMKITNIKVPALTEDADHNILDSVPTFDIQPKDMAKAIKFEAKEGKAYDKGNTEVGSWSKLVDEFGEYWLFSDKEDNAKFTVTFWGNRYVNKKAGLTVYGCDGGYYGSKTANFAVKASKKLVKNDVISKDMQKKLAAVENVYCGEGITMEDIIAAMNADPNDKKNDYTLDDIVKKDYILDTHYIITYKKNVNKGTATMTFKGVGIYAGSSFTQNFKIVPVTLDLCVGDTPRISSMKITQNDKKELELTDDNWQAKGRTYVIKDSVLNEKDVAEAFLYDAVTEKNLTLKTDFTVTYKVVNGVQKAIIKGANNYSGKSGKAIPTFEITKVAQP